MWRMKKDFKNWHSQKSELQDYKARPFFHEREIWFTSLGVNVGFEQDGKGKEFQRPVLILKKFNNESFWGLPLTTKKKKGKYYHSFNLDGRGINTVILSQLKFMDAKRLQYKIGMMEIAEFNNIKQKLKLLIA